MNSQKGTQVWYWKITGQVIYARVESTGIMPDVRLVACVFFGLTCCIGDSPPDYSRR